MSLKTHEDWLWTTLFWDNFNSPLGEDKPNSLSNWNYQMCAIANYHHPLFIQEGSKYEQLKNLGEKIQIVFEDGTWCSNPYLEHGENNQKTNCIGCHQYAGEIKKSSEILVGISTNLDRYRNKNRTEFRTDYSWAINFGGQNISRIFKQVIEHYDIYDPSQ